METMEVRASETEKETRRSWVIARLLSLEKSGVNGANWQEVENLEKELRTLSPITNQHEPEEINPDRRRRMADREAISRVMEEAKQYRKTKTA